MELLFNKNTSSVGLTSNTSCLSSSENNCSSEHCLYYLPFKVLLHQQEAGNTMKAGGSLDPVGSCEGWEKLLTVGSSYIIITIGTEKGAS